MESSSTQELFDRLLELRSGYNDQPADLLELAYEVGSKAHEGQTRESGEAYFTHPLEVAIIMTDYHADDATLCAGMLHDVLEDTGFDVDELWEQFGDEVVSLVESVTNVGRVSRSHKNRRELQKLETVRKVFEAGKADIRVFLIKLADRLHNMRTLAGKNDPDKRRKKAIETQMVYLPLSLRLGMGLMYAQLEKLVYAFTEPSLYREVYEYFQVHEKERKLILERNQKHISQVLTGISVHIEPYELEYKLLSAEIQDIESLQIDVGLTLNVIAENEEDFDLVCSRLMTAESARIRRHFHTEFEAIGYTIRYFEYIDDGGNRMVLHVMTPSMKQRNDLGFFYDLFIEQRRVDSDSFIPYDVVDKMRQGKPYSAYETISSELARDRFTVYCDGEPYFMDPEATALDLAFEVDRVHAKKLVSIKSEGKEILFRQVLQDKSVYVLEFGKQTTVDFSWIYWAKTARARAEIQKVLSHKKADQKVILGRQHLQKHFELYQVGHVDEVLRKCEPVILKHLELKSLEELFILVSLGGVAPHEIVQTCFPDHKIYWWQKLWRQSKRKKFHLRIKGVVRENENLASEIYSMAQKSDVEIVKSWITKRERKQQFIMDVDVIPKRQSYLHEFVDRVERLVGISRVRSRFSFKQEAILWTLLCLIVAVWSAGIPMMVRLFETYFGPRDLNIISDILLLGVLFAPLIVFNIWIGRTLRIFLPQVRRTRWFLGLSMLLNLLAVIFFFRAVFDFDIKAETLVLPLFFFIFSCAFVIYQYTSNSIYIPTPDSDLMQINNWDKHLYEKIRGYLYRLIAVCFFGTELIVVKYFLEAYDGLTVTAVSVVGAWVLMLPFVLFQFARNFKGTLSGYSWLFILIAIARMSMFGMYYLSVQHTSATNAILFMNLAPVMGIIFGFLFWRHRVVYMQRKLDIARVGTLFILAAVGTALLVFGQGTEALGFTGGRLWGDILAFIAMCFDVVYVLGLIFYSRTKSAYGGVKFVLHQTFLMGLLALPFVIWKWPSLQFSSGDAFAWGFMIVGIFFLAYWFSYEAYKRVDGFINYLLFNLAPLITIAIEVFYFDMSLTWVLITGGGLILLSAICAEYINTQCEKRTMLSSTNSNKKS